MRRASRPASHLSAQGHRKDFQDFQDSTWACLTPLLFFLPPLLSYSILIQSILCRNCSGEKDVAEATKRIITTGSKQSCKSIPSGHGGCCMKQRQDRQCYALEGKGREGRDKRKGETRGEEERQWECWTVYLMERVITSARCCLIDVLFFCSSVFMSVSHSLDCWSHPRHICIQLNSCVKTDP